MRYKNPSSILGYATNLLKAYSEIQKQLSNTLYRIIDIKQDEMNSPLLVIQVIGKANIFEVPPKEIAADDSMLEGFSKKDVRTITHLASKDDKPSPEYEIVAQNICSENNSILYKLKRKTNQQVIVKSAKQITLDKILVKSLNPEDALNIGYAAGLESVVDEKTEINKFTNKLNDINE